MSQQTDRWHELAEATHDSEDVGQDYVRFARAVLLDAADKLPPSLHLAGEFLRGMAAPHGCDGGAS